MFQMFKGGDDIGSWPASKIVAALKSQYSEAELLGEDGPLKVYGVQDNGVNFVVALMQSAPESGKVVELGFLARFVGFPVDLHMIEMLNRNLHISAASLEGTDLFLMAGVQVSGAFDQGQFMLLLEAWRRDLMVTLHGLSGSQSSMAAAFPAAKLESAVKFATNAAPQSEGEEAIDMLSSFLGAKAGSKVVCGECGGRGKRGFIARMCDDCDGTGFVSNRR